MPMARYEVVRKVLEALPGRDAGAPPQAAAKNTAGGAN